MYSKQHTEESHRERLNKLCRICGKRTQISNSNKPVSLCKKYAPLLELIFGIVISEDTDGILFSNNFCSACYTRLLRLKNDHVRQVSSPSHLNVVQKIPESSQAVWMKFDPTVGVQDCSVCRTFFELSRPGRRLSKRCKKSTKQTTAQWSSTPTLHSTAHGDSRCSQGSSSDMVNSDAGEDNCTCIVVQDENCCNITRIKTEFCPQHSPHSLVGKDEANNAEICVEHEGNHDDSGDGSMSVRHKENNGCIENSAVDQKDDTVFFEKFESIFISIDEKGTRSVNLMSPYNDCHVDKMDTDENCVSASGVWYPPCDNDSRSANLVNHDNDCKVGKTVENSVDLVNHNNCDGKLTERSVNLVSHDNDCDEGKTMENCVTQVVKQRLLAFLSERRASESHNEANSGMLGTTPPPGADPKEAHNNNRAAASGAPKHGPSKACHCQVGLDKTQKKHRASQTNSLPRPVEEVVFPLSKVEEAYLTRLVHVKMSQTPDKQTLVCKTRGQPLVLRKIRQPRKAASAVASMHSAKDSKPEVTSGELLPDACQGDPVLEFRDEGQQHREQTAGCMEREQTAGCMEREQTAGCMEREQTAGCMERQREQTAGCMKREQTAGCMEEQREQTARCMQRQGTSPQAARHMASKLLKWAIEKPRSIQQLQNAEKKV